MDEERKFLTESIINCLKLQLIVLPNYNIKDTQGNINRTALGYIYGYIDSTLRICGYDMRDVTIGVPITCEVLESLFGRQDAEVCMRLLIKNIGIDTQIMKGIMLGGQQCVDFFNKKLSAPMGLSRTLLEGDSNSYNKNESQENKYGSASESKKAQQKNTGNVLLVGLFVVLITVFVIVVFDNSHDKIKSDTPQKQTIATPPQQNKNQVQPEKKQSEYLPKIGVKTSYVKGEPIANNDGNCQITIDNTKNAIPVKVRVWSLSSQAKPIRTFTIKENDKFTVDNLSSGKYDIRYVFLYENNEASNANKSEIYTLKQNEVADGIEYDALTLTLYSVVNGNAKTSSIPLSEL